MQEAVKRLFGSRAMSNLVPIPQRAPVNVSSVPQVYEPERPELRTMLGMFLQRAGLGLGVAAAIFGAVMVYTWVREPLYTAYGSLLVDPKHESLTQAKQPDYTGQPDTSAVDTQVELLRSREVAQALSDRYRLYADPEFNPHARKGERPSDRDLARTVDRVQDRISVGRNGQTYVITAGFSSNSPTKAANLANGLMQVFMDEELKD
jgi:uncharacterized protein involved in exopolysaccharide biosynthesis